MCEFFFCFWLVDAIIIASIHKFCEAYFRQFAALAQTTQFNGNDSVETKRQPRGFANVRFAGLNVN